MRERISERQLRAAAFTAVLAPAAAAAPSDWRGALPAIPAVAVLLWALVRRADSPGGRWLPGKGMALFYIVWGMASAGRVLALCGQRMARSAPNQASAGGFVLLVVLPILWLGAGKPAAFGRAAEIFCLVMGAALAALLAAGVFQVEPRFLLSEGEEIGSSFLRTAGLGCLGIWSLLLWQGQGERVAGRWLRWSGAWTLAAALMGAVTVGCLSAPLARRVEQPFFLMTVGLGNTARLEGVAAALWLVADVTFGGLVIHGCRFLLKEVWGWKREKRAAWLLTAAVLGVCLIQLYKGILPEWVMTGGGLILGAMVPLIGLGKKNIKK